MKTEIILENVSIMCLREKIAAYATLFNCEPILSVSGTFRDKAGELAFLSRDFYQADIHQTYRRYLTLLIDGEVMKLAPVDDMIARVKLS